MKYWVLIFLSICPLFATAPSYPIASTTSETITFSNGSTFRVALEYNLIGWEPNDLVIFWMSHDPFLFDQLKSVNDEIVVTIPVHLENVTKQNFIVAYFDGPATVQTMGTRTVQSVDFITEILIFDDASEWTVFPINFPTLMNWQVGDFIMLAQIFPTSGGIALNVTRGSSAFVR